MSRDKKNKPRRLDDQSRLDALMKRRYKYPFMLFCLVPSGVAQGPPVVGPGGGQMVQMGASLAEYAVRDFGDVMQFEQDAQKGLLMPVPSLAVQLHQILAQMIGLVEDVDAQEMEGIEEAEEVELDEELPEAKSGPTGIVIAEH